MCFGRDGGEEFLGEEDLIHWTDGGRKGNADCDTWRALSRRAPGDSPISFWPAADM